MLVVLSRGRAAVTAAGGQGLLGGKQRSIFNKDLLIMAIDENKNEGMKCQVRSRLLIR